VCSVETVYYKGDVPQQWADYYKANVKFFREIGTPGGDVTVSVFAKTYCHANAHQIRWARECS
jgi:hypothetical protein